MRIQIGLVAMAMSACGLMQPAPVAQRHSEAMERSARMLKALDRVEAELHDTSADIGTYNELVDRHGQAQQIACAVTTEHVNEIHRLELAQQKKRAEKQKKRRQMAMVSRTRHALASR